MRNNSVSIAAVSTVSVPLLFVATERFVSGAAGWQPANNAKHTSENASNSGFRFIDPLLFIWVRLQSNSNLKQKDVLLLCQIQPRVNSVPTGLGL
jgi:hypothetical protein